MIIITPTVGKRMAKMSIKLNEIKIITHLWPFPENTPRKHETSINRLRIGHTLLTHQHLVKIEEPPISVPAAEPHSPSNTFSRNAGCTRSKD